MSGELVPLEMPTDLPAIEREISEHEALMRTDRRAYNADTSRQMRLRNLYEARAGSAARDLQPEAGADEMAIVPLAEFRAQAPDGDYGLYLGQMRAAADVVYAVPGPERLAFIRGLEALPDAIFACMIDELMNRSAVAAGYATDAQVRAAMTGYPGASIVREWGAAANQNLAHVRARLWRCIDSMASDQDADAFHAWLGGLTEAQAKAVYRKLAA
jgi:hypothetical protein